MGSQNQTTDIENGTAKDQKHNGSDYEDEDEGQDKLTFTLAENPPAHITVLYAFQVRSVFLF